MNVATTQDAIRLMGLWISRADAGLARRGTANAHLALAESRLRRLEWESDQFEVDLREPATSA